MQESASRGSHAAAGRAQTAAVAARMAAAAAADDAGAHASATAARSARNKSPAKGKKGKKGGAANTPGRDDVARFHLQEPVEHSAETTFFFLFRSTARCIGTHSYDEVVRAKEPAEHFRTRCIAHTATGPGFPDAHSRGVLCCGSIDTGCWTRAWR